MNLSHPQPIDILLIEDSPTDILITREALADSPIVNTLHVVTDGVEALAFLRQQGKYANVPRPRLILLDLNLPRKDGTEVLKEIKADEALNSIPVVILTTSKTQDDLQKAYGLHANCYVVKSLDYDQFADVVHRIENFWFRVVTLAPNT